MDLAIRDNVNCRRIIVSAEYKFYWGKDFHLYKDVNAKKRFKNTKGGEKIIKFLNSDFVMKHVGTDDIERFYSIKKYDMLTESQVTIVSGTADNWIYEKLLGDREYDFHNLGIAKSVEVWQQDKLVGGLYGVDLGKVFCGERMFSLVPNASKVALVSLIEKLKQENYLLLDCQVHNNHLEKLGAFEITRDNYLKILKSSL
jgi:hypothetical protein